LICKTCHLFHLITREKGKGKWVKAKEKSENRKVKSENDRFCQLLVRVTDVVRHGSMYHVTTREREKEKEKKPENRKETREKRKVKVKSEK
jgi:hypothetical protein